MLESEHHDVNVLPRPARVAAAARACGPRVAVIACGERWPDGGLRPSLEDRIGAGAVLACLDGAPSPRQLTDVYLLAVAVAHGARLVTLDRSVAEALMPVGSIGTIAG